LPVAPLDGKEAWQIFRAMRVESVTFGQILRKCLPGFGRKKLKPPPSSGTDEPRERGAQRPAQTPGDGEPSAEAQRAIADALRRISDKARDARKK
jgi:hypothetical protein